MVCPSRTRTHLRPGPVAREEVAPLRLRSQDSWHAAVHRAVAYFTYARGVDDDRFYLVYRTRVAGYGLEYRLFNAATFDWH
jgi:hypothetical protein